MGFAYFRFMRLAQKRGQHVRRLQVKIIVRTIKICGHRRNEIGAVFPRIGLAEFNAGDLRYCVSFTCWLKRASEQGRFWNRLRRELGIDAGASKKEKLAHPGFVGRVNDVVLNPQVTESKLDWKIVVCLDAADLR